MYHFQCAMIQYIIYKQQQKCVRLHLSLCRPSITVKTRVLDYSLFSITKFFFFFFFSFVFVFLEVSKLHVRRPFSQRGVQGGGGGGGGVCFTKI